MSPMIASISRDKSMRFQYLVKALLIGSIFYLTGCDYWPFHESARCSLPGEENELVCEMGDSLPLFTSSKDVEYFNMCQSLFQSAEQIGMLTFYWRELVQEKKIIFTGGYCDYTERLSSIVEDINRDSAAFKNAKIRLFSCNPDDYGHSALQLREKGFSVELERLERCN